MGRHNTKRQSWRPSPVDTSAGIMHNDSGPSYDDTSDIDSANDMKMPWSKLQMHLDESVHVSLPSSMLDNILLDPTK